MVHKKSGSPSFPHPFHQRVPSVLVPAHGRQNGVAASGRIRIRVDYVRAVLSSDAARRLRLRASTRHARETS